MAERAPFNEGMISLFIDSGPEFSASASRLVLLVIRDFLEVLRSFAISL